MGNSADGRPVVCFFESRRADELSALVVRQQATPCSAPSMREVPIEENPAAIHFLHAAVNDQFPVIILLTGVGTDALFEIARSQGMQDELLMALRKATLVVRGPKPAAVLHRLQIPFALKAPEPNTSTELLTALDQAAADQPERFDLRGKPVAVQEYGLPNDLLTSELQKRGALVTTVPVYRWALPEDTLPMTRAIDRVISGEIEMLLFTSAQQIVHVLMIAERDSQQQVFRDACQQAFVGSIGPTCSAALRDSGLPVHFEASPPKMGPLVRGALEAWRQHRQARRT